MCREMGLLVSFRSVLPCLHTRIAGSVVHGYSVSAPILMALHYGFDLSFSGVLATELRSYAGLLCLRTLPMSPPDIIYGSLIV